MTPGEKQAVRVLREKYGISARQAFTELPEWELQLLLGDDEERIPPARRGFGGPLPPHLLKQ